MPDTPQTVEEARGTIRAVALNLGHITDGDDLDHAVAAFESAVENRTAIAVRDKMVDDFTGTADAIRADERAKVNAAWVAAVEGMRGYEEITRTTHDGDFVTFHRAPHGSLVEVSALLAAMGVGR
jgi:hypothetical protein